MPITTFPPPATSGGGSSPDPTAVTTAFPFPAGEKVLRSASAGTNIAEESTVGVDVSGNLDGIRDVDMAGDVIMDPGKTVDGRDVSADWTTTSGHIASTTVHGVTGNVVGTGGAQAITGVKTMTTPVLLTPVVADYTTAQHNHTNAATGGLVTAAPDPTAVTATLAFPTGGQLLVSDAAGTRVAEESVVAVDGSGNVSGVGNLDLGGDILMVALAEVDGRDVSADGAIVDTAIRSTASLTTDNSLVRVDGGPTRLVQNSLVIVSDLGEMTGLTGVDVTGDITVSGTVDGRDVSADAAVLLDHNARHESGGADAIKLDDLATPDDNTDLNATSAHHGLAIKLSGDSTDVYTGTGGWTTRGGGGGGDFLTAVVDDTAPQLGGMLDVNGQAIGDGTRALLTFVEDGSAVNHLEVENQATLGGPILRSTGTDANVDLHLDTKGSGVVSCDAPLDVIGNITTTGNISLSTGGATVDGRDLTADGAIVDTAVTNSGTFTADNRIVLSNGTARAVDNSGITVTGAGSMSGVTAISMSGDLTLTSGTIVLSSAAGTDINVSETGIDRNSASDQTFNIQNSGAGAMQLQEDSVPVVTAASTFATDNKLLRSDGTARASQSSAGTLSDAGVLSGVTADTAIIATTSSNVPNSTTLNNALNYLLAANVDGPRWRTGTYRFGRYQLGGTLTTFTVTTSGLIYYTPIFIPERYTLNLIMAWVTTGVSGDLAKLAIYGDTGGLPGSRLAQSSALTTTTSNTRISFDPSITADAGHYWLGCMFGTATTLALTAAPSANLHRIFGIAATSTPPSTLGISAYTEAGTFATGFPSTATTGGSITGNVILVGAQRS